jgi:hypothetical protein
VGGQRSGCGTQVETSRGTPSHARNVDDMSTVDPGAAQASHTVTRGPWEPVGTGCRADGTPLQYLSIQASILVVADWSCAGSSSWMHLSRLFTLAVRDRSWKGARPRSHRVHQCRRLVAAWPHALLRGASEFRHHSIRTPYMCVRGARG